MPRAVSACPVRQHRQSRSLFGLVLLMHAKVMSSIISRGVSGMSRITATAASASQTLPPQLAEQGASDEPRLGVGVGRFSSFAMSNRVLFVVLAVGLCLLTGCLEFGDDTEVVPPDVTAQHLQIGKSKAWWKIESLSDRADRTLQLPQARFVECTLGMEDGKLVVCVSWIST